MADNILKGNYFTKTGTFILCNSYRHAISYSAPNTYFLDGTYSGANNYKKYG